VISGFPGATFYPIDSVIEADIIVLRSDTAEDPALAHPSSTELPSEMWS